MKSLAEVAAHLNAIKTERSHTRIVVPSAEQNDENYRLIEALLAETGIDQDELAGMSLHVGASAVQSLETVDGGIDAMEMIGLIGSIWVDGVILGARFAAAIRPGDAESAPNGSNGASATEPARTADPTREAAQDDPRGERDA